jgi:Interferon-related developmental regulator (IFRD)
MFQEYEEASFDSLCMELKSLSTECNKYRAKKDRRQQRSSFRDILHSVEKGDFNSMRIRVSFE